MSADAVQSNPTDPSARKGGGSINYAYQLFMLVLCIYAIAAVVAGSLKGLSAEIVEILVYADAVLCVAFFADFLRSLYFAENRWKYLYTWGWIDLLSSIPTLEVTRIGRAARILRILRILRALRATKTLTSYFLAKKPATAFYSVLIVSLTLIAFASITVLSVERSSEVSNIRTAEDALWWAFTTITTVGYGDRYPVTPEGRAIAVVLMTAGVAVFATLSGVIASYLLAPPREGASGAPKDI